MDKTTNAESIFDFLTAQNPDIDHQIPESKSLTSVRNSFWPRQLKIWDEFDFSTLKAVYGGRLITEASQKGRSSLAYPSVLANVDDVVYDEPTTTHVLTIWNHRIVATSLQAVQETLHPSMWVQSARKKQNEVDALRANPLAGRKHARRSARLKPDGGAVSFCPNCCSEVERLPKDYKPASKWQSSTIFDGWMTGTSGCWTPGQARKNEARPIRQVYTYCVAFGCRYGCIVTTQEAFIFRIKPRTGRPVSGTANRCPSKEAALLRKVLATDGLMEYVSIPWENHRPGNQDDYGALTMNLALWFVHILAGNAHEVDWDYPNLPDEKLTTGACTAGSASAKPGSQHELDREEPEPPQTRRSSRLSPHSRKRRRNSDLGDNPHYSFAKLFESFATQPSEQLTDEGTQSWDGETLEKDGEKGIGWDGRSSESGELLPEQSTESRAPKRLRNGKVLPELV